MGKQTLKVGAVLGALLLATLVLSAAPAVAGGGSSQSAEHTEDTDTNDGGTPNNVSDDGDNAHPSGKDRSVEHGNSGNQGKSNASPDDTNGPKRYEGEPGSDKANGPGGTDLADQDANNGCGNDDDFDDDNNGWCGKPKDSDTPTPPEEPPVDDGTPPNDDDDDDVDGDIITVPPDDEVLGGRITRSSGPTVRGSEVRGSVLPFTGGNIVPFVVVALALIGIGALVLRAPRLLQRRSDQGSLSK